MARANFVSRANKDIYQNGKRVTKVHIKGKNAGQEYTDVDKTQPMDDTDIVIIKRGESYYWWQFRYGGINYSRTTPKPQQLTQNPFLQELYSIQEALEALQADQSLDSDFPDILERIETLRDEQQEKMDNMPEGLQGNSPAYDILQERYDALDDWYNELENIDTGVDDQSIREEMKEEYESDHEDDEVKQTEEEKENEINDIVLEKTEAKYQEILEEIQGCTCGI